MRKITGTGLTDVGRQRDNNEDAFAVVEDLGLYICCDGMGGHASGEVASRMTVDHAVDFLRRHLHTPPNELPYKVAPGASPAEARLSNAIQHANDRVYIEGMKDSKLEGMGTTVVAAWTLDKEIVLAHVGDSRIYRWSGSGTLEQVTRDHSLLNYKIDRGELRTPEEIAGFKQGNVIVRAIGLKDYVEPEVQTLPRRPGDLFLMCSDGLTDLVDDWALENVVDANHDHLDELARCCIRMANDRGGKDNITVVLVRVDDRAAAAAVPEVQTFHEEETQPNGIKAFDLDTQPSMKALDPAQAPHVLEDREEDTEPGRPAFRDEDLAAPIAGYDANDLPVRFGESKATSTKRGRVEDLPSIIIDDELTR